MGNFPSYCQSNILSNISGIAHGYSTRASGDMRISKNRLALLDSIGCTQSQLVMSQQVHGNRVHAVNGQSVDTIAGVDGLLRFYSDNAQKKIAVGVVAADCVPILFADIKGRAVAAAHAGWKGTRGNIVSQVISEMKKRGIPARDILVFLGPHIGKCCYTVSEERARQFLSMYNNDEEVAREQDGIWHLDIGRVNVLQLASSGVPKQNIELSPVCTSCHNDEFFSYRKDSKQTYGEIMALIGFV